MKNAVYVVTMYRFGDRERHSYVNGVYDKKALAVNQAEAEELMRGGKYKAEVLEVPMNTSGEDDLKVVVELKNILK